MRDRLSTIGTRKLPLIEHRSCTKVPNLHQNWCIDQDMVPRYVGKNSEASTNVTLYTHGGYSKCLANKTVVFIGDSRVRYQYMHLAGFLRSKKFMKCDDQSPYRVPFNSSNDPECYLIDYESHGGRNWNNWFKESVAILKDLNDDKSSTAITEEEQQDSICDCYYTATNPFGAFENRYTKRWTRYGEINLIYFKNILNKIEVDLEFPPFSPFYSNTNDSTTTTTRCIPGECSPDKRKEGFTGDLNATLWEMLPRLNATHAFINLGWESKFPFLDQSQFTCIMEEYMKSHPNIKLYLISHPPPMGQPPDRLAAFDPNKLKCNGDNVGVLDRSIVSKYVPPKWYWDNLHVLSILNEEYNHQLVKKICPINQQY